MSEGKDMMQTERRWSRWSLLFATAAVLISLVVLVVDRLFVPEYFQLQEVVIESDGGNVNRDLILQAVADQGPRSWFSINLNAVERAVTQVPWVYSAKVRRQWPARLIVHVVEAVPAAQWNKTGWLSQRGEILIMPKTFVRDDLPRLSGAVGDELVVTEMYQSLAERLPGNDWRIAGLHQNSRGAWQMTLRLGLADVWVDVEMNLGKQQIEERFLRFCEAFKQHPLESIARMQSVDLRYSNGVAIRWLEQGNKRTQMAVDDSKKPAETERKS